MRIGIDARLWSESGVGRYIRNLVKYLQTTDTKNEYVLFIMSKDAKSVLTVLTNKNWHVVEANIKWHTIAEQIKMPLVLSKYSLDLVHFPYFSVPIFYRGPYIVTVHDLILHHFPTGDASTLPWFFYNAKLQAYKIVLYEAVRKAKHILTVSKATRDELLDHLPITKEKITITYEGIDASITSVANHKAPLQPPYFLHVGNVYPHKNIERLLTVFRQLSKEKKHMKLVLVGKEDYFWKRYRKKITEMQLDKDIIFIGHVSDKELAVLYNNAEALIIPSLMEGFGLPAVEAMAHGCLVIASDIPSLKEICGDAALYMSPYITAEMKKVIETVMKNGKNAYKQQIAKGKEIVRKYDWLKLAKETIKVYESSTGI